MKKTTMLVFALALCSASTFAQQLKTIEPNGKIFPSEGADPEPAVTLTKIFSNLGTGTNVYTSSGWSLSGPLSSAGFTQYVAMPFKSKANAHIEQVRAAVQYSTGTNQLNLSIYTDSSGTPGTRLAGPFTVKNLPLYFTCCRVGIANVSPSVAITAGTQYWLVADTPASGTGSDFAGAWVFIPPTKMLVGINTGASWFSFPADVQEPAGAIYGSIP